jgi:hypothetical protein
MPPPPPRAFWRKNMKKRKMYNELEERGKVERKNGKLKCKILAVGAQI